MDADRHRRRAAGTCTLPGCLGPEIVDELRPHLPPGFDFSNVRLRPGIPWWAAGSPHAIVWRETVHFAPGAYDPTTCEGVALIAHELAHVEQFRRDGALRFAWRYLLDYLRGRMRGLHPHAAYCDIGYEREAREVAAAVRRRLYGTTEVA